MANTVKAIFPLTSENEVKAWLAANPTWLKVRAASAIDPTITLGAGECEAISLTKELAADLILIDDKKARQAAIERGLSVAGTLNILELESVKNPVELSQTFDKLRQTNSRVAPALLVETLERRNSEKQMFNLLGRKLILLNKLNALNTGFLLIYN